MFDYQYAYILGALGILFPIWLLLYLRRKDVRREMLMISVFGALAGPFAELVYLRDYWMPETIAGYPFGIEALVFGFSIAGIAAVAYEEVFGRRLTRRLARTSSQSKLAAPLLGVFLAVTVLALAFGTNSIYATIFGLVAGAIMIVAIRRDLLWDSLVSGVLMGLIMFCAYCVFLFFFPLAIERWWRLGNVSGLMLRGIPIEELLWAFSVGLILGPLYEFLTARRLARR